MTTMKTIKFALFSIFCLLLLMPRVNAQEKSDSAYLFEIFSKEQAKADIDAIVKNVEDIHPNPYAYTSEKEIKEYANTIKNKLKDSINRIEFYKLVVPLIVRYGDGHIQSDFIALTNKYISYCITHNIGMFPFSVLEHGKKIFVNISIFDNLSIRSGDEIKAINNIPVNVILETCCHYLSGESNYPKISKICSNAFMIYLAFVYDFKDSFNVSYISQSNNKEYNISIPGAKLSDFTNYNNTHTPKWEIYTEKPIISQEDVFNFSMIKSKPIGYLNFYSFELDLDKKTEKQVERKVDTIFCKLKKEGIKNLIIDIRGNDGGEDYCTELLMSYLTDKKWNWGEAAEMKYSEQQKKIYSQFFIKKGFHPFFKLSHTYKEFFKPANGSIKRVSDEKMKYHVRKSKFDGNIYVLIGVNTFSSAVTFAAICKCYGIATLIGKETGGVVQGFTSTMPVILSQTKMRISVSSRKVKNACGDNYKLGLTPDITVVPEIKDILDGKDSILKYTIDLIDKNSNH